ncbi:fatty acid hydroxylase superfamily protein [Geotalea daltonii FRC-32]|uniref:Fatty acid hydroxylase superfamily protein n=1 Tax=Geotalea daltonii (strain DSM 22248 / JCM 15807 / FRC-32) TaxID=316067 RepID=B9M9I6_GEODF|nr:sterol desaturase family protein [Geotalea daltonii]ACM20558.1 fatty acid hydroxylase superfamily protein [Geotalea daltonii FRC-32]
MARTRDILNRELPPWLNAVLVFGTLATVVYFEIKRPLRKMRQDKVTRNARNVFMSWTTAATIALTEKPVTAPLSRAVERYGFGLLKLRRLPVWADLLLSVVLLDYTLYIWHYLTHKVPFLWRFHLAHHVDMDLDASTALRFHAGEMLLSVLWRATQVAVLGISPLGLALWQTLTLMEIMFHHSNVRLSYPVERRLCRLIVTPRMHGIHHSVVQKETDSNWSTIFSWPDYFHGTIRLNVPQDKIITGVAAYQNPAELTVGKIMKLPFTVDRPSWVVPQRGRPQREGLTDPVTSLLPEGAVSVSITNAPLEIPPAQPVRAGKKEVYP